MHTTSFAAALAGVWALAAASPAPRLQSVPLRPRAAFTAPGIATFNNFIDQQTSVCYDSSQKLQTADTAQSPFGAGAGDISPDVGLGAAQGQTCSGSLTSAAKQNNYPFGSQCANDGTENPKSDFTRPTCQQLTPQCPASSPIGKANNGKDTCYQITATGYNSSNTGIAFTAGTTIVRIIDSCPAGHPQNFCKKSLQPYEKCHSPDVNSLDIDLAAYQVLTGASYVMGQSPNVNIMIEPTACPGPLGTAATQ